MSVDSVDFDFRLDGKAALVTGGAAGIGAAIAAAYAAKGARLAVVDLDETGAARTAAVLLPKAMAFAATSPIPSRCARQSTPCSTYSGGSTSS